MKWVKTARRTLYWDAAMAGQYTGFNFPYGMDFPHTFIPVYNRDNPCCSSAGSRLLNSSNRGKNTTKQFVTQKHDCTFINYPTELHAGYSWAFSKRGAVSAVWRGFAFEISHVS